jgi:peptidoglycan/xylan/chitin deacetylase (PgdA/CDA1 family)
VNIDLHSSWLLQPFYPSLTWKKKVSDNSVFLTFDDGPEPEATNFVLKTLSDYGFEATFFCIGENVEKHLEIYQEIGAANHSVGNHTQNHFNGFRYSTSDYVDNVRKAEKHISSSLFRPPYGRIKRKQIHQLQPDYEIIMWSVLSCDYMTSINVERALKRMKEITEPGSIVVFHDSQKALKNLEFLLPRYCEFLVENGYKSCRL